MHAYNTVAVHTVHGDVSRLFLPPTLYHLPCGVSESVLEFDTVRWFGVSETRRCQLFHVTDE